MHKHTARLVSIACLAALSVTLLAHVIASSDSSVGGGIGFEVDDEHGYYALHPELAPGDHFEIGWEWVLSGFRPVFKGGDFYVVEGDIEYPFDPAAQKVLFHGHDEDPGSCCQDDSRLEMSRKAGQGELTLLWVMDYDDGWAPTGPQTTGLSPMLGGVSTTAHDREVGYIRAFMFAASDGMHGGFDNLRIVTGKTLDRQPGFLGVETILAVGALAFWAFSLGKPQPLSRDGGAAGLVALVERGRDHLRAQFRLHLLVGPLLFIAAIFGIEALDNGGFSFYDPTGLYEMWIALGLFGLWLTALVIWLVGLIRVSRSLRHFNRTQEPDLGA